MPKQKQRVILSKRALFASASKDVILRERKTVDADVPKESLRAKSAHSWNGFSSVPTGVAEGCV
ncbi:MAG: hypothetical protein PHP42_10710 [Bacteroidota bacterium]|nr:hypothetical protein [Bacteroidota bacterium]